MLKVRKAVIPAAGLGTRFLPATKAQPKEMLPLVDKPIIQYVVEEAVASGIEDILIITGRGKRAIEDHFDRSIELEHALERGNRDELLASLRDIAHLAQIHFIRQKEPRGLGHAVYQARWHVGDEPFAVLLGDEVFDGAETCLAQLLREHARVGGTVVAVREVPAEEVHRYGIVRLRHPAGVAAGAAFPVADLVEKPARRDAPSRLAVVGRYVIDPEVFEILEHLPPGVNGEIQLTDALRLLAARGGVHAMTVAGRRYDVGDKLGFLQATVEMALARPDLSPAFSAYLAGRVRREPEPEPAPRPSLGPGGRPTVTAPPARAAGTGLGGLPLRLAPGGKLVFTAPLSVDAVTTRSPEEIRPVLRDPSLPCPAEPYRMYRGICRPADAAWMEARSFRYDVTVIPPGRLGSEYPKTHGHYHPLQPGRSRSFGEVYEVLSGRAVFVLQRPGDAPDRVEDVLLCPAGPGEQVVMLPGYGHVTVNVGNEPLVLANWVDPAFQSLYDAYRSLGGAAYHLVDDGGRPAAVPNPRYARLPAPRWIAPADTWRPLPPPSLPMYAACLADPDRFEAVLRPPEDGVPRGGVGVPPGPAVKGLRRSGG